MHNRKSKKLCIFLIKAVESRKDRHREHESPDASLQGTETGMGILSWERGITGVG